MTPKWSENGLNFEGTRSVSDLKNLSVPVCIKNKSYKEVKVFICPECEGKNVFWYFLVNANNPKDVKTFDFDVGYCDDCKIYLREFKNVSE